MSSDYKETGVPDANKDTGPQSPELNDAGIQAMRGSVEAQEEVAAARETPEIQIVGTPEQDARFHREQDRSDTCAIAAQEGIIQKHTGQSPGEETLRQRALQEGWYQPGRGTHNDDIGKLVETYGVELGYRGSGSMEVLHGELEQQHDVIAAVNAGELWRDPRYRRSGHAVWVTGLETGKDGSFSNVFLNDSGNPAIGASGQVSAEQFERAWRGTDHFMVSTRDSASQ